MKLNPGFVWIRIALFGESRRGGIVAWFGLYCAFFVCYIWDIINNTIVIFIYCNILMRWSTSDNRIRNQICKWNITASPWRNSIINMLKIADTACFLLPIYFQFIFTTLEHFQLLHAFQLWILIKAHNFQFAKALSCGF